MVINWLWTWQRSNARSNKSLERTRERWSAHRLRRRALRSAQPLEITMRYPNVLRRYLATLFDLFAWWCLIYAISRVPSVTEHGASAYALFTYRFCFTSPCLQRMPVRWGKRSCEFV